MSLLNYFERKPNNPEDSLSKTTGEINHGLTDREREEVIKQLEPNSEQKGKKRTKYCTWSPQQRAEIGQYAALNQSSNFEVFSAVSQHQKANC